MSYRATRGSPAGSRSPPSAPRARSASSPRTGLFARRRRRLSRSPATSMSPPAPATASPATGSSRCRATSAATARPSTSAPPSASRAGSGSRRRSPPSRKRRTPAEPSRALRAFMPPSAITGSARPARQRRRSRAGPSGRRAGMAAGREDRREEEQVGAGALGGADLGEIVDRRAAQARARGRGRGCRRRPRLAPARRARRAAAGPRCAAAHPVEQGAPLALGEAVVAEDDAGAARQPRRPRRAGRRPAARRSSARGAGEAGGAASPFL